MKDFTIAWGAGYSDPVWGYDTYKVVEHKSDWTYLYIRPTDNVIEFIVDSNNANVDYIAYFPAGLTWDKTVIGVWDYTLKYASCPANSSFSFLNAVAPKSLAKNVISVPSTGVKPRAINTVQGGVKSLFKTSIPKTFAAIPSKATFTLNKAAPKVSSINLGFNSFATAKAPVAAAASLSQDEKLNKIKSFAATLKATNLQDTTDLATEVNMVFDLVDANEDGFITPEELRDAIEATNQTITDDELNFVFQMVDSNLDGQLSWTEVYNFALTQEGQVSLYTRSEKVNLVFQYYDRNGDGYLNQAEVKRLLVDSYGYATDSDASWFISLCDTNGDRKISWMELYNAIQ